MAKVSFCWATVESIFSGFWGFMTFLWHFYKAMAKIRVVDYLGLEYENVWKDKKGKNHKILLKQNSDKRPSDFFCWKLITLSLLKLNHLENYLHRETKFWKMNPIEEIFDLHIYFMGDISYMIHMAHIDMGHIVSKNDTNFLKKFWQFVWLLLKNVTLCDYFYNHTKIWCDYVGNWREFPARFPEN